MSESETPAAAAKPPRKKRAPAPTRKPLEIVYRKVAELKPDPNNSRTHSKDQIEQIRASIRAFGFTFPILLKKTDMIGAGHARFEAAKLEGIAEVPTITRDDLTDKQWRAYVIADNKLALNSKWDDETLRTELTALTKAGMDLTLIGFSELELGKMNIPGFEFKAPNVPTIHSQYSIIIDCGTEKQQEKLLTQFKRQGLKCRALVS